MWVIWKHIYKLLCIIFNNRKHGANLGGYLKLYLIMVDIGNLDADLESLYAFFIGIFF